MEFLHEETESMCSAHDKCLEMVAPRYSSRALTIVCSLMSGHGYIY